LGANLRRPFWTEVGIEFLLLVNETSESISIGLKMYPLLTKNSARGAVRLSDRLGGRLIIHWFERYLFGAISPHLQNLIVLGSKNVLKRDSDGDISLVNRRLLKMW